jgi:hypothetical protein
MTLLSVFEARLSVVPRWSIVRTIQKQSVAEHCYRVAIIAPRVYELIRGHEATLQEQARLTRAALLHDQYEAFTGDIPSPAKNPLGVIKGQAELHFGPHVIEMVELEGDEIMALRAADLIEGIYFLYEDQRLGNMTLQWIIEDMARRLFDTIGESLARRVLDDMVERIKQPQDPLDMSSERVTQSSENSDIPF